MRERMNGRRRGPTNTTVPVGPRGPIARTILPVVPLLVELFELDEEAMGGRELDVVSKILCL